MRVILELSILFTIWIGLTDAYIYKKYISRYKQAWAKRLHWLLTLLTVLAMAFVLYRFEPRPEAMHLFCNFLIVFLAIYVPKAIFALLTLLGRRMTRIATVIAFLVMGAIIYGATEGVRHFQVKEVTIASQDIPQGFDGYRIVQISDIHCGSWTDHTKAMQRAVNLINGLQPDLIVFTGDLVNNLSIELDEFMPVLSQLKAKHGVYSVLGNHDYSMYIQWEDENDRLADLESLKAKQTQMGWTLLNNRHVKLHQAGDSIALIGVENSGRPPFPDRARLSEAMEGTDDMFKILLSHDPSQWRREVLPKTDIQLTLSGHTHAMQTKILGFTPARFVYPENDGLYQEGEQMLYVNIGLGHLMYPMRLGAWPEITLLTLEK